MSMNSRTIFSTALVLGAASLTAACGGHGPNSYLMPKDAVVEKLSSAQKTYRTIGGNSRTIKATSTRNDTIKVRLAMDNGNGSPQICEAIVEAIDEEWTRVTPSCKDRGNAMGDAISEMYEKEVDEWVIAVLYDTEIDGQKVAQRSAAVAIDNMPEMQREALDADREFREQQARGSFAPDSGSAGSDWGQ